MLGNIVFGEKYETNPYVFICMLRVRWKSRKNHFFEFFLITALNCSCSLTYVHNDRVARRYGI